MTPSIENWVQEQIKTFHPGRVLEIGAMDVNGNVRQYFTDTTEYIGIDLTEGPNVDVVLSGHNLTPYFDKKSFDTVLCLETLEHDPQFWLTVEQIYKVIKPGGHVLISTPSFNFPYHAYPIHPYLFSKDAYDAFIMVRCSTYAVAELYDTAGSKIIAAHGIF